MSREKPLVSVVIASYNHADFLEERLESILGQTYNNLEIILVDDKSSDGSVEIIRKYLNDKRLGLYENQLNLGWVGTSNKGFSLSSGKYLMFANCDDTCLPNLIEKLVDYFETETNLGLVYCKSNLINFQGQIIGDDFQGREKSFKEFCNGDVTIPSEQFNSFLLHSCVIPNLSAALIRRDIFERLGGFSDDYKICSDWDFYIRLSRENSVGYIVQALNSFRQHQNTIRAQDGEEKVLTEIIKLLLSRQSLMELNFGKRIRSRYQVSRVFAETVLKRERFGFDQVTRLLKTLVLIDHKTLIILPISLVARGFNVVLKFISAGIKGV